MRVFIYGTGLINNFDQPGCPLDEAFEITDANYLPVVGDQIDLEGFLEESWFKNSDSYKSVIDDRRWVKITAKILSKSESIGYYLEYEIGQLDE